MLRSLGGGELMEKTSGFESFAMHLIEAGDAIIPFEQGGDVTGTLDGFRV